MPCVMTRQRDLDRQSWRERRWQTLPPGSESDVADRLFAAAREAGRTPSLFSVVFYPFQGWKDEMRLKHQAIAGLRATLPEDCFPFSIHASGSYFVTTTATSADELKQLADRVQLAYDTAPVRNGKGEPIELELTAWFVDDDQDFEALAFHSGPTGMLAASPEVFRARHLSDGHWSQAGLTERLIPAMREQVGKSGSLTVVGVKPVGDAWAQYLGQGELYEIELHVESSFRKLVREARVGALAYLQPPRLMPTQTSFPQMLLLPLDEPASRRLIEPNINKLDSNSYWGRDMDYQYTVELAKPGEIRIAAVFLSLAPDTDAAAACAHVKHELAAWKADDTVKA